MEHSPSFSDQLDVDYISHHGIKGMKWGVRRFQNTDGSLTIAGRKRYQKTADYISDLTRDMKTVRDYVNTQYAVSQNNYEVMNKAKQQMLDNGEHTEKTLDKMYPNYNPALAYDKRSAEYYKEQIALMDATTKQLSEIDVKKNSFKKAQRLVDDIIEYSTKQMTDLKNDYVNSDEYQQWQKALQRSNESSRKAQDALYKKYKL